MRTGAILRRQARKLKINEKRELQQSMIKSETVLSSKKKILKKKYIQYIKLTKEK